MKKRLQLDKVRETAKSCFVPLTVGGGVSNIEDIKNLLLAGADKVSINTAAVKNHNFIKEISIIETGKKDDFACSQGWV